MKTWAPEPTAEWMHVNCLWIFKILGFNMGVALVYLRRKVD